MIDIDTRDMRGVFARLADKAAALGLAREEAARRRSAGDHTHWRRARLLWPLFTKD